MFDNMILFLCLQLSRVLRPWSHPVTALASSTPPSTPTPWPTTPTASPTIPVSCLRLWRRVSLQSSQQILLVGCSRGDSLLKKPFPPPPPQTLLFSFHPLPTIIWLPSKNSMTLPKSPIYNEWLVFCCHKFWPCQESMKVRFEKEPSHHVRIIIKVCLCEWRQGFRKRF